MGFYKIYSLSLVKRIVKIQSTRLLLSLVLVICYYLIKNNMRGEEEVYEIDDTPFEVYQVVPERINPTRSPEACNANLVTIVTAFLDIGPFGKGHPKIIRTIDAYLNWAKTFHFLQNPLVVYTDSEKLSVLMKTFRAHLSNKTKVILFDRNSSWAFKRNDMIKEIYAMKDYPKFYPNTVVPEYSCAMHAKYDVITRAVKENFFHTQYFAWLDIGLFRWDILLNVSRNFILHLPHGFNSSRIAVNRVFNAPMHIEMSKIFKGNAVWVCGCIFVGERNVILKYAEQYKLAVDYFISKQLMNTDQQIIYALYSEEGRKTLGAPVPLQLYEWNMNKLDPWLYLGLRNVYDPWFYLGYIMRHWT